MQSPWDDGACQEDSEEKLIKLFAAVDLTTERVTDVLTFLIGLSMSAQQGLGMRLPRKVILLKPDQPDRWVRPCNYVWKQTLYSDAYLATIFQRI